MSAYTYRATTLDGKIVEGIIEAADSRAVASRLQDMGYIPIKIGSEAKKGPQAAKFSFKWQSKKVGNKDVLIFSQELLTLIKSGLPLDRSLAALAHLAEKEALKEIVQAILKDIKGGKSLSEAMQEHPKVFPKLYVNMIKAGEASGALDQVLARLVQFMERSEELRSYFATALIYPSLLTLVGGASIIVLIMFVIPKFAKMFADMGAPPPLPMEILLGISNFLVGYWWLLITATVLVFVGFRRYVHSEEGRLRWDRRKLRIPLFGTLSQKIEVARFARTLGTLLHSAVPLLHAMNIVKEVVTNKAIAATMDGIKKGIKKGEGLAIPIRDSGIFPPLATHLLEVGEESGKLDAMLLQIADIYDEDARAFIKRLISLFEPVMILVMGLIIGTIVVSMLMAIFSVFDVSF